MHITQSSFQFVPIQDWNKEWVDSELYQKYKLTKDQILHIEASIKPMQNDNLFSDDEVEIDRDYGSFDVLKFGVSVGDRIVYTPTGQELTVLEDNKVEYGGEQMTIGEFTAKNMPENSISKSGVCKGPKYFSYKGVSLYKLKESFLGGQKKK